MQPAWLLSVAEQLGVRPCAFSIVQSKSGLSGFTWDATAQDFIASNAFDTQLTTLLQFATLCRLVNVEPLVQCLPLAAAGGGPGRKLRLALQLTVPGRTRLMGWQPEGAPVSAEAQVLSLSSDVPQLSVAVLVRQQGGMYVPVVLTLLSRTDSECPTLALEVSTN